MSYFTTYQINDHIYQLKDPMGVLTTLIIGNEKALLIDTAYGIGNLKKEIENLTTLPLIVINSHGHMDHSGGNFQFDEVFIDKRDLELCILHNNFKKRNDNIETATKNNILPDNFEENINKLLIQPNSETLNTLNNMVEKLRKILF